MSPKILVIRLSSLGDVVLTAPIYRSLKAAWPEASISVLVKPSFAQALEGNPHISEIIPYEGFLAAWKALRSRGFTHVLDLHANLRSFFLRRLAGAAQVSVYRKDALARRLFVAFGRPSPALQRHVMDRYLEALRPWGVEGGEASLSLEDQREARRPHGEAVQSVLLIQSAFLGDSLTTLPLAREIKEQFPGCRLAVLAREDTADIFRDSPWVDEAMIDLKRGVHGGVSGLWRLSRVLKAKEFDWAIIPHRSFRSALLAYLAGIPRRVGFAFSAGRFLFTRQVSFSWPMHDLERNLSLLLPLKPGLSLRRDVSRYLEAPAAPDPGLEAKLARAGITPGRSLVGLHPGSRWATKRWLPERFTDVACRLKTEGFQVVLVGGREDAALCVKIARESGALDLSGRTSLRELKALVARMKLFITNDSGPMHLAAALGIPTLAIFGATTRELGFFPYGPEHRVLEASLACRPCRLHGGDACPRGHFLCMKLVTADQAWEAAKKMLGRVEAPA